MQKDVLVAIIKPILDKFLGGAGEQSIPKFSLMGGVGNMVEIMQAVTKAQEHIKNGTLAETLVNGLPDNVLQDIEHALHDAGYINSYDYSMRTTIDD